MSWTSTTLACPKEQRLRFQRRLSLVAVFILLLSLLLLSRLFFLQVHHHAQYATLSDKNQFAILPIEPKRGLLFDRDGVRLTDNRAVFTLSVIPQLVPDLSASLNALKQWVQLSPEELERFEALRKQSPRFRPIPLKTALTESERDHFLVRHFAFPGFLIQSRQIRAYPQKNWLAHLIGRTHRITPEHLARLEETHNYTESSDMGTLGLEAFYEQKLRGTLGSQQVETNARGQIVRVLKKEPAIAGQDLHLTIDLTLQKAALQAFEGAPGSAVALNPNTGEILAWVSSPSYDPNLFMHTPSAKTLKALQHTPNQPLFDRALKGQYPIASTIKPFIALKALEMGVVGPDDTFRDPGFFKVPGTRHIYHDWLPQGHGWVNLKKALSVSCDTFFYRLAYQLKIRNIEPLLRAFGFGKPTGIDLPSEKLGLVATPDWKEGHIGKPWYPGDTINAGIGQGYLLATPLQLARAVAILATQGHDVHPHILKTKPSSTLAPIVFHATPEHWRWVFEGMASVIKASHGTGFRFGRHAPYTVAAKTGTAQVVGKKNAAHNHAAHLRDHSLFVAFAPIEHPKIALAVIVEHNARSSAVIARKILDTYFRAQHERKQSALTHTP